MTCTAQSKRNPACRILLACMAAVLAFSCCLLPAGTARGEEAGVDEMGMSFNGTVASVDEGTYFIRSCGDMGLYADIPWGAAEADLQAQLCTYNGSDNQRFVFKRNYDGSYEIRNVSSGYALEASPQSKAVQNIPSGNGSQRWFIERLPDGSYGFRCKANGLYIDVPNALYEKFMRLQVFDGNGTYAQRFILEPVDGPGVMAGNLVTVEGVDASYTYTGSGIAPDPTVRKAIGSRAFVPIPENGTCATESECALTFEVVGGRTYTFEVDRITCYAGPGIEATWLVLDKATNRPVEGSQSSFRIWGAKQSKTFTPAKSGTLVLYSSTKGAVKGTSARWEGARLYELLKEGRDYSVAYRNNVSSGTATVEVKGAGAYSRGIEKDFTINRAPLTAEAVAGIEPSYRYTASPIVPRPVVRMNGRTLSEGTDYTVSYADNRSIGNAGVAVSGIGNYTGSVAKAFRIVSAVADRFPDVAQDLAQHGEVWYVSQGWLDYVVPNKIMTGYKKGQKAGNFGPYDTITRGEVATILFRSSNPDSTATTDPKDYAKKSAFKDVAGGQYYTAAIDWCKENKVITGYADTGFKDFKPDAPVTREELATMVARYAKYCGENTSKPDETKMRSLKGWKDTASWAKDGVAWCTANDVIGGVDNHDTTFSLDPKGKAWRASMAKIITVAQRDVIGK